MLSFKSFQLIVFILLLSVSAYSQTFIKGPALIEGLTSTVTAAGTTNLTKDSQTNQQFTGATTQTVVLPNATTLPLYRYFVLENRSSGIVTVQTFGGGALTTIAANMQKTFIVTNTGVAAGTWDVSSINISDVAGILPLLNGGTNKAMTASAGSVAYSDADSFEFSAVGSAGQILSSNGTSAPAWTTSTYPTTNAANDLIYGSATNVYSNLTSANNSVLLTNGSGVPSWQPQSSALSGNYWNLAGNTIGVAKTLGSLDAFGFNLVTNNTTRIAFDDDGSFTWTVPTGQNGLFQLGTALSDTNDIRIARGSSGLTPFDGSALKVSNVTSEAVARSQYAIEAVANGQNAVSTTTRYGGILGVAFHNSASNLTATDVGLVGVVGLGRATGATAASTVTNGAGGSFVIGNDSTNQVITNAFGVRAGMDASITNTTNGVTNLFGYYMRDQSGGSSFDGSAIAGIPASSNRWGIYLNDPSQNYLNGQVLIGQKSSTVRTSNLATTSALLDLNSTTGALLLPRMTTTQKNALTPTAGMIVYDTTLGRMDCYNGSWVACSSTLTTKGDLSTYSTTATRLPVGTDGQILTANSATSTGLEWQVPGYNSSTEMINLGISSSVASNALTIRLKQADGTTDPSSVMGAVKIAYRSGTVTSGSYNRREVTAPLSIVISNGSTLGQNNGGTRYIYVYALDNAGTIELAVSSSLFKDNSIVSTTAEGGSGGADSLTTIYSTTARSNVPIRRIGRFKSTQTTAGVWASAMQEAKVWPIGTIKRVSGILRNIAGTWVLLNDEIGHAPENVASVSTGTTTAVINFSFTATNILSFLVAPDEEYAKAGLFVGASVGSSSATINFAKAAKKISGLITYNGSSWVVTDGTGNLAVTSFTAGVLALSHDACTEQSMAATSRNQTYVPVSGSNTSTTSNISFIDWNGTAATTANTNMAVYFQRDTNGYGVKQINSADMAQTDSNLFFVGYFEE